MPADASAGIIRTSVFTNGSTGSRYVAADGAWLSTPDAVLLGDAGGADAASAVLLSLSSPVYDADLQVRLLLFPPAPVWSLVTWACSHPVKLDACGCWFSAVHW